MADDAIFLVVNNPDKRYHFSMEERCAIIEASMEEEFGLIEGIEVEELPAGQFTARVAKDLGATLVVRGLRNVVDFEYEHSQQLINTTIEPGVTTVFVMPPTQLIAVSSSAIKSMVGIEGWEELAENHLTLAALNALRNSKRSD